jgi:hypothetical protein
MSMRDLHNLERYKEGMPWTVRRPDLYRLLACYRHDIHGMALISLGSGFPATGEETRSSATVVTMT